MWKHVVNWFTLRDYTEALDDATNRIVRKQSRGSIHAQNGDIMHELELKELSAKADRAIRRLPRPAAEART